MRVFPRISYTGLGARRRRRGRTPRPLSAARALLAPQTLALAAPPLLLAAACLAYAYRPDSAAFMFALAVAAAAYSAAQAVALRRLSRRTPLRLSAQDSDDRRFLLDLSGGVRAATSVGQLYEQVAAKIESEFRVESVSLFIRDDVTGEFVCRVARRRRRAGGPPRPGTHEPPDARQPPDTDGLRLGGEAFVIRRLRHLASPLAVEPESFDLWVRAASPSAKGEREREAAVLRRAGARLLVQVNARERLTGVLVLGPRAGGRAYTADEKLLLLSVAGQLALVVENSKLLERIVEEERLRRELAMAAEVQQRLFPERPPPSDAIELAGYCQPARKVGGDYYDFLAYGSGQTGLVVADVAGKGISAALLMSTLQASLRAQVAGRHPDASADGALAELVATLNRLLCNSTGPASYVTFFYAQFDERTFLLSYVNAGHNPPLIVRAGVRRGPLSPEAAAAGTPAKLDLGGPVLGLFEGCRYEQGAVRMQAGDVLVGYTDGVVEALNSQGAEFGERRLQESVAASGDMTAEEICARVVERVAEWCAGTPQHDDLTLIVLKVRHSPA